MVRMASKGGLLGYDRLLPNCERLGDLGGGAANGGNRKGGLGVQALVKRSPKRLKYAMGGNNRKVRNGRPSTPQQPQFGELCHSIVLCLASEILNLKFSGHLHSLCEEGSVIEIAEDGDKVKMHFAWM